MYDHINTAIPNFELGKGDTTRLKNVFAASLNIHIAIALTIVVLAESIGLWFVNYKLVIPADRLVAANWVFQFAILSFCVISYRFLIML